MSTRLAYVAQEEVRNNYCKSGRSRRRAATDASSFLARIVCNLETQNKMQTAHRPRSSSALRRRMEKRQTKRRPQVPEPSVPGWAAGFDSGLGASECQGLQSFGLHRVKGI